MFPTGKTIYFQDKDIDLSRQFSDLTKTNQEILRFHIIITAEVNRRREQLNIRQALQETV